ncbi:hypothetical protein [Pseudomonas sp.]|uniref:hypothetical protein n=1 Tax=Pseudomonas sp. TaxID=306 RepID=UPI00261B62D4|nr:hypothetical protein [Pseudomonas sp.]
MPTLTSFFDHSRHNLDVRAARFSRYGRPPGPALPGLSWPQVKPLRTVHGVVTACPAPSPRTTTEPCTRL